MAIQRVSDLQRLDCTGEDFYKDSLFRDSLLEISHKDNSDSITYTSKSISIGDLSSSIISSVLGDPNDPSIIYYHYGNHYFLETSYFYDGIVLSGDLCVNWDLPDEYIGREGVQTQTLIKNFNNILCAINTNQLIALSTNILSSHFGNIIYGDTYIKPLDGTNNIASFTDESIRLSTDNLIGLTAQNINLVADEITMKTDSCIWYDSNGIEKAKFDGENFIFHSDIYGCSMSARWADLAELYEADAIYSQGTVIGFGGSKEITIASKTKGQEANAIITTRPGFILNSNKCESKNMVGVALVGRTPVKIKGKVKKFDRIVLSEDDGIARAYDESIDTPATVILGKSLQESSDENIKLIECVVQMKF